MIGTGKKGCNNMKSLNKYKKIITLKISQVFCRAEIGYERQVRGTQGDKYDVRCTLS